MAAKIIAWAPSRLEAIRRMRRALEELTVDGLRTNVELMHQILYHPVFVRGNYTTAFLDEHLDTLLSWIARAEESEA